MTFEVKDTNFYIVFFVKYVKPSYYSPKEFLRREWRFQNIYYRRNGPILADLELFNTPPPMEARRAQIVSDRQKGAKRVQTAPDCRFPRVVDLGSDTM